MGQALPTSVLAIARDRLQDPDRWWQIAALLLVATLVFFAWDYCAGITEHYQGRISGRSYQAAYTTPGYFSTSSSCSGSGKNRSCHDVTTYHPPVYHPPRWFMHVESERGRSCFDISEGEYEHLVVGTPVPLRGQVGHFTGYRYASQLDY